MFLDDEAKHISLELQELRLRRIKNRVTNITKLD